MICTHPDCTKPVTIKAFAAYSVDPDAPHPLVASYPMAMVRACDEHVIELLRRDWESPGSTRMWLLGVQTGAQE